MMQQFVGVVGRPNSGRLETALMAQAIMQQRDLDNIEFQIMHRAAEMRLGVIDSQPLLRVVRFGENWEEQWMVMVSSGVAPIISNVHSLDMAAAIKRAGGIILRTAVPFSERHPDYAKVPLAETMGVPFTLKRDAPELYKVLSTSREAIKSQIDEDMLVYPPDVAGSILRIRQLMGRKWGI